MFSTRTIVLSAASFAALAQAVTVNTPASAVQCQPVQLSWAQGTAPFYVSIIPGGQPSAAALENLPNQSGNSYTWMVDIAAGTSITVKVVDSTGDTNYSDQITIQQGTTTECASSGSGSGAGASSASSATSAVGGAVGSATSAIGSAATNAASNVRSAASGATSAAGAALSSARGATSSSASNVGANAAAATTSPTGAASSSAKIAMSLVAGAAALFALVA